MSSIDDSQLTLPVADKYPIVLISGNALRHERFAMRMQAEFSDNIVAWLQLTTAERNDANDQGALRNSARKARAFLSTIFAINASGSSSRDTFSSARSQFRRETSLQKAEEKLFSKEINKLRETCTLRPIRIESIESEDTLSRIKRLNPYFIVVFCPQICISMLRARTQGLILSQDEPWTPECGASCSVYWALYHRDLSKIVSTIHLWRSGDDADIVVRSSAASLAVDDTVESCLVREAALGTELICEVIGNLIKTRTVRLDRYQDNPGTSTNIASSKDIRHEAESDLQRGLIKRETERKMAL